jgi:hypothetical protein
MKRLGPCLMLFVAFSLSLNSVANNSRLTVVSEILDPAFNVQTTIPLYLSRVGTYFVELYLEVPDGLTDTSSATLDVSVLVTFLHRENSLFERQVAVHFTPKKRVATLLYVEMPFDLPQRRALEMNVTVSPIDQSSPPATTNFRIQLTRKPQILVPQR